MPGMGPIHGFCISSQVRAIWAGLASRSAFDSDSPKCLTFSSFQILDGSGQIFHGDVGIRPVLVAKIDHSYPQPFERFNGDGADLLGAAIQLKARMRSNIAMLDAQFGGNDDLALERFQRFAEKIFIGERTVDFGGVKEGDAAFDRFMPKSLTFARWLIILLLG